MSRKNRLVSKNAFACNITFGPTSYAVNGASQESGEAALATVQAENSPSAEPNGIDYPSEGNHFSGIGGVFKDHDATAKLVIDGGTGLICRNMRFSIAGVSGTYMVTSVSNDTVNKAMIAPSVTTIYFKRTNGGNLISSPANDAALTFDTTFNLPELRMDRDITIVNNDTSNAINIYLEPIGGSGLQEMIIPSQRFSLFPVATLAASAAMTFETADASAIFVKGTADSTITIFGS
jgi:hypothetical protein